MGLVSRLHGDGTARVGVGWQRLEAGLLQLTGAAHVQVLLGSGTLANDAVAAQLGVNTGLFVQLRAKDQGAAGRVS